AHPARRAEAEELRETLGRDVPLQFDPVEVPSADPAQRWRNGRASWELHDPASEWCMGIPDDTVACEALFAGLPSALGVLDPGGLVCPYAGTGRPDQTNVRRAIRHAENKGHAWWSTRSLCWGVAIIVPTYTIPDMLKWCSHGSKARMNYDMRIGRYYR